MFVFLDIDGVLNKESQWKKMYSLDEGCVEAFCKDFPNARIILLSSWKGGFISSNNPNNSEPIRRLEKILSNGVRILGKVNTENKKRDELIRDFIREHNNIEKYVVIDDDETEYNRGFLNDEHLMLINSKTGYR